MVSYGGARRVLNGCRTLLAAAKSTTTTIPKPTPITDVTAPKRNNKQVKKSTTEGGGREKNNKRVKKSTTEGGGGGEKNKKTRPVVGILKPSPISPALGHFLGGVSESPRTDAVKKIWDYIKLHQLQNPTNKREIICDDKLKTIFDGKDKVGFLEIAKLLGPHFVKST